MANVRQLPSGRWQLRVYLGRDPLTGKKLYDAKTVTATGKRDAQRQANAWEAEVLDSGAARRDRGTFGQLLTEWQAHKARRWSPSTARETAGMVDRYLGGLRGIEAHRITTHTLDVFYAELTARGGRCTHRPCPQAPCTVEGHKGARCQRKGCERSPCAAHKGACAGWVPCEDRPCRHGSPLAASTVNRVHVIVHAALEQAVRWGWIRTNPAEHAEPGEVIEEEVDPPRPVDVIRLLAEAEAVDARFATYLAVAIETGARRGAIHAMRWSDVDLAIGTVRFPHVIVRGPGGLVERPATRTKRNARRPMAVSPHIVATLIRHHDAQFERAVVAGGELPADALVFSDDVLGGRPWVPDSTSRKFRHLRTAAGLEEARLHDLRHFMATQLLAAGVDPKVIAQRGGWARAATMLDRYAHALPASDRAAAGVLGGLMAGDGEAQ